MGVSFRQQVTFGSARSKGSTQSEAVGQSVSVHDS
jgi:hypothetical protein